MALRSRRGTFEEPVTNLQVHALVLPWRAIK
jgi:hypothetical protein